MKTIMRLSSNSGKEYLDVVKDDINYILQTRQGSILVKRGKYDEDGVRSIMETLNELTNKYGWKELHL